ncbi:response regulator [Hyalangium rubrum]|uniref:histidine kinase n=1 Tax=Hyalangium rubrum TaxID=3103134 RepID=A0ABU5H401_9BACT|nr:response regulator [Hyalangium sp. s54d21]MDY7228203.1 response regulator [Hyalangium sp. s54d21]
MKVAPLRLLLIEDDEEDAALLLDELQRGFSVNPTRVETPEELASALSGGTTWDLVIADYLLPLFNGLEAFAQVQQRGLDVPFFIVSGKIDEEVAVAAMKSGVHDFLLKDRLGRLIPAVARELREAALRAERRGIQEQLLLSDRLASLGLLAASVAHEINNPLASLMMDLEFALSSIRGETIPDEGVQALRDSRDCAVRIRDIIRDIKLFSRSDEHRLGPTDLHRVLDSSLRMAWNHVFHRARLSKDYGDIPPVHGSEARLGQVFLNLIINAAQAIPDGRVHENEIRVVTRRESAESVRVEIHDTGPGVPVELHERIFEPFFTTKPVGVGTGLGLSICRRLIVEMGGSVGVENHEGRGSVFWVRLRTAEAAVSAAPGESVEQLARGLNVLIIDDEVPVARAIKRLLGEQCEVTALARAQEALRLITSGRRFDAILCDMLMPEMSGPQFHEALGQLDPEQAQRITFMSGGAFSEEARSFLDRTQASCIEKPIDMQRLAHLLDSVPRKAPGN